MWSWLEGLGAAPGESDGVRAQRLVLIGMSLAVVPGCGTLWTLSYLALGERAAAMCVVVNILWMLSSFAWLAVSRHYPSFRTVAMAGLTFPVVTGLAIGDYGASGGLLMLGVSVPVLSLLDGNIRRGIGWLMFYFAELLVAVAVETLVLHPERPVDPIEVSWVPNTVLLGVVIFAALAYAIRKREEALQALARERQRSDDLLLNVLPAEVVDTLKAGPEVIAEPFSDASILFADVVGFTPLSEQLPADEMVGLLNEVFSHFDSFCEKHGVEKIRTIGDGYMVAAGVPTARPDHAQALARMALDMMAYTERLEREGRRPLRFRVGINSGPLVAGVIGHKKFQYDVWGDTVNTAARMESHGLAGRIQITHGTRERLGSAFACSERGEVQVKGKGVMRTWFVDGHGQEPAGGGRRG